MLDIDIADNIEVTETTALAVKFKITVFASHLSLKKGGAFTFTFRLLSFLLAFTHVSNYGR